MAAIPTTTKKSLFPGLDTGPNSLIGKINAFTSSLPAPYTPKAAFTNSLMSKAPVSTPNMSMAPKVSTPAPNMSTPNGPAYGGGIKVTANPAATAPVAPKITAPTAPTVSTPKSNYTNMLLGSSTTLPTAPTVPTPGPNAAPIVPKSTAKDDYISAYKSYIDALNNSKDVTEAKKAYNDFVANQAKSKAALEGQGRGIPLTVVRGNQEKLLNQTNPEALRLQNEISIAQDSQKATVDSLKAGVDMYGKILEQDKPVEVDGILYQPQSDGSYKAITSKASEGFTLGKDQTRFDAQGNPIATSGSGTTGGSTYTPGANPQADAWVKYVQNGGKISDVPDEYKGAVALGTTSGTKPQSEISKQVVSVIDELLANPGLSRISGPLDQIAGGLFGDAALAKNKFNQLKGLLSLENIKYLKGTGSISDAEQRLLENAASAVARNLSDTDFRNELIKLKNGLDAVKDNQLAPDEEQFLRSQGYSEDDINKFKASFSSVGNTTASIPPSSKLAYVNNNPGNLRFAGQAGAVQGEGGFAKFPTVEAGVKALENQIKVDASRGLSLASFISKYAPPSENDTSTYIKNVVKLTGASPLTPIADIDIKSLTRAIARLESSTTIA